MATLGPNMLPGGRASPLRQEYIEAIRNRIINTPSQCCIPQCPFFHHREMISRLASQQLLDSIAVVWQMRGDTYHTLPHNAALETVKRGIASFSCYMHMFSEPELFSIPDTLSIVEPYCVPVQMAKTNMRDHSHLPIPTNRQAQHSLHCNQPAHASNAVNAPWRDDIAATTSINPRVEYSHQSRQGKAAPDRLDRYLTPKKQTPSHYVSDADSIYSASPGSIFDKESPAQQMETPDSEIDTSDVQRRQQYFRVCQQSPTPKPHPRSSRKQQGTNCFGDKAGCDCRQIDWRVSSPDDKIADSTVQSGSLPRHCWHKQEIVEYDQGMKAPHGIDHYLSILQRDLGSNARKEGIVYLLMDDTDRKMHKLIKIGTTSTTLQERYAKDSCGRKDHLKHIPIDEDPVQDRYVGAERVEKLVQAHLARKRVRIKSCAWCDNKSNSQTHTKEHIEWFRADLEEVVHCVRLWRQFVRKHAYDGQGRLSQEVKSRLESILCPNNVVAWLAPAVTIDPVSSEAACRLLRKAEKILLHGPKDTFGSHPLTISTASLIMEEKTDMTDTSPVYQLPGGWPIEQQRKETKDGRDRRDVLAASVNRSSQDLIKMPNNRALKDNRVEIWAHSFFDSCAKLYGKIRSNTNTAHGVREARAEVTAATDTEVKSLPRLNRAFRRRTTDLGRFIARKSRTWPTNSIEATLSPQAATNSHYLSDTWK